MAEDQEKPTTERRVHVLPVELLERIRTYQNDNNIPSEVEAVRRLLSEALQARDTIDDIMKQVRAYFRQDRDLRTMAKEVLSGHILVNRIVINDTDVEFGLRNGDAGSIKNDGSMRTGTVQDDGHIWLKEDWPRPQKRSSNEGWGAPSSQEKDEEIPF
ncbi:hypothetical protein AA11826_2243 [Komagataeibacter oboediens DSM 11826]|uniref:Uncharacterized protein n=1 Tax=Komagataeibacter oboediens TaxID=65958 RepID=A0A318QRG6_9PROT|nr:hypothetical protein [Komagataeibacter oboediens]PYD80048.1 hypothetical protein CFR80_14290 [Komagataeibacter oboediens]GBQ07568.1 hypothetical protein AA11826_2243 [Komagataeibacter oboediens DSM 11826]